jgi:hypothetical protein
MIKKFNLLIAFSAEYEEIGELRIFEPLKISDITVLDEEGKEVKPRHNYEFQDLIDSLNQEKIHDIQVSKYGDLDIPVDEDDQEDN